MRALFWEIILSCAPVSSIALVRYSLFGRVVTKMVVDKCSSVVSAGKLRVVGVTKATTLARFPAVSYLL